MPMFTSTTPFFDAETPRPKDVVFHNDMKKEIPMSQQKGSNQRKTYFVKKDFQIRFIVKFCMLLLAGVVVSTGLLFFFSPDSLTSSYQSSGLEIKHTNIAILPSVIVTNLITLGLITLGVIIVTLLVSHKIAGPLFRFEKELDAVAEGDLTKRVVLRQKDQGKDMADSLNRMISSFHDRISDIRKELHAVRESAHRHDAPPALIHELEGLDKKISRHFKT
jgi:methyl-accepting chemotaxis protein